MTPKQREFARLYAQCSSSLEAARGAGYSEKYSRDMAHTLLKKDHVIAEVKRIRERLNQMADKSATDVVNEYARIAFTDRTSFLKEDPHFPGKFVYKSPAELTPEQRAIVERVEMSSKRIVIPDAQGVPSPVEIQTYKYVLATKADALQQMGRHFGIFDDKLQVSSGRQNPFKNASPEQLAQLKKSFIGIMHQQEPIKGQFKEVKK